MNFWIIGVGEPLPVDGENTRLRRAGNLVQLISTTEDEVDWFSVSFNHYEKKQRTEISKVLEYKNNYRLHIAKVSGYKKNVSFSRILHHKDASKKIRIMMEKRYDVKKPDIIVVGNTPIEVSEMVTNYGKKYNIPVIVDVRDLWPEVFKDSVPRYLKSAITPYVLVSRNKLKKVMSNTFGIVGLSNKFLEISLNYASRNQEIQDRVIPIGYPNYIYEKNDTTFSEHWNEFGLKSTDFIISFTGNFGRQFDFEPILSAANILLKYENIKFVLCGLGENQKKIMEKAPNNIIFANWIEKDRINNLLAHSKLGIAPYINSINFRNNTPNKFGEYLSASLPILVSVSGEMENLLKENSCGFRYTSGQDLAEKIQTFYEDESLRNQHSLNARELYELKFNSDNVTSQYKKYLEEVVEIYDKKN